LKTVLIGLFVSIVSATPALAESYYRSISYNLQNAQNNIRRQVCVQRVLGQCVQWREEVDLRTRHAWSGVRQQRGAQALTLVAQRMLDPKIASCALNNAKRAFNSGAPFRLDNYGNVRDMVNGQMKALLNKGFPRVNVLIDQLGEGSSRAGEAYVGNYVDARQTDATNFRVTGAYDFTMDVDFMDTTSDVVSIAGVMAHEMMHQMSHDHPNGYDDENLVVAFQNCFVNNGSYASPGMSLHGTGLRRPVGTCGAKKGR